MTVSPPDRQAVIEAFRRGEGCLVWRRVIADLETPLSAYFKLTGDEPNSLLLESVEGGDRIGRFSVIATAPDVIWESRSGTVWVSGDGAAGLDGLTGLVPLDSLRRLIAASRIDIPSGLPPMAAGLFGYLGYEMVREMERLPSTNPDVLGIPDARLMRPGLVAVFDQVKRDLLLVCPLHAGGDPQAGFEAAQTRLDEAERRLSAPLDPPTRPSPTAPLAAPVSNMSREAYEAVVRKAVDYTLAGDIFQMVPSQRFSVPFEPAPIELYRALRRLNPSPFLFHLNFGAFSVVGSSPEIMVRVRERTVTVRPIAGTRPRGADAAEDAALADELLADPKELAEHLMLLDLGRNDVGRVARIGSVRVTDRFTIERYSHVMHIVSNVEGALRDEIDVIDALVAGFPAGTVSGAPKIRAMELIDELEVSRRGLYAGAVGYIGAAGALDTCIALRTGLIKDGMLHVQAGGGVVADSDPATEYQETVNKARALFRAAEEAYRVADPG